MRHGKKFNHLGRKSAHRAAMLSNMASSLIEHKRINTTVAKARELRKYIEPLITRSKDNTTHNRRVVFSYLQNKETVTELFSTVSAKVGDRPGGYTRIIKTGNRAGDNADMCMIELVDFNEIYTGSKKEEAGKTRRSRRSGGAKSDVVVHEVTKTAPAEEIVVHDVTETAPEAAAESNETETKTED